MDFNGINKKSPPQASRERSATQTKGSAKPAGTKRAASSAPKNTSAPSVPATLDSVSVAAPKKPKGQKPSTTQLERPKNPGAIKNLAAMGETARQDIVTGITEAGEYTSIDDRLEWGRENGVNEGGIGHQLEPGQPVEPAATSPNENVAFPGSEGPLHEPAAQAFLSPGAMHVYVGAQGEGSMLVDRQALLAQYAFGERGALYGGALSGGGLLGARVNESANLTTSGYGLIARRYFGGGVIQKVAVGSGSMSVGAMGWVVGGTAVTALDRSGNNVQMEQTIQRGKGAALSVGMANGIFGVFARGAAHKETETIYRTWLPRPEAKEALDREHDGVKTWVRNKLIAVTYGSLLPERFKVSPSIEVPDIADPNAIQLGDELVQSSNHALTGGVTLAAGGFMAGAHLTHDGAHEKAVRRMMVDGREVLRVAVSPRKRTDAFSVTADLVVAAESHANFARSKLTRFVIDFDTQSPEAMEAYTKLVTDGVVPVPVLELDGPMPRLHEAAPRVAMEKPPEGVRLVFSQRTEAKGSKAMGGGVTLPRYIPKTNLMGISVDRTDTPLRDIITDGENSIETQGYTTGSVKEMLHRGQTAKEIKVFASRMNVGDPGSVELSFKIHKDRMRQGDMNKLAAYVETTVPVGKPIREAPAVEKGIFSDYEAEFSRTFDAAAIAKLVDLYREDKVPPGTDIRMKAFLHDLANAPQAVSNPASTLPLWKKLVRNYNVKAFSALHVLLDDNTSLKVKSAGTKAIEDYLPEVNDTLTRFHEKIEGTPEELEDRVAAVSKGLRGVEVLRQHVVSDVIGEQFAPQQRAQDLETLNQIEDALKGLLDIEHLPVDRAHRMIQAVKRSTAKELARLDVIRDDGLPAQTARRHYAAVVPVETSLGLQGPRVPLGGQPTYTPEDGPPKYTPQDRLPPYTPQKGDLPSYNDVVEADKKKA